LMYPSCYDVIQKAHANIDRWKVGGSVTANIGWYVVPILHDQPSCNIDIT